MTELLQFNSEPLLIKGVSIPTETRDINYKQLKFWADNPRIHSIIHAETDNPTQDDIYERLKKMEHVRVLITDIKENGGLIDPIIVKGTSMEVLEGNSRLAAYCFLAEKDPIKWSSIRCRVLLGDTDQSLVFALLGQYHVKGKKDWAPYEKAGFIYRRHKQQKIPISDIATELGMSAKEAKHLTDVFGFMLDHEEAKTERWSFYDEYLRSQKIGHARKEYSHMDKQVVEEIRSGNIPRATDLRDQLPLICENKKILKKYLSKKTSFEDASDNANYQGGSSSQLKRLKTFRNWIAQSTTNEFTKHNRDVRQKIDFELKQLEPRIKNIRAALEKRSSEID